MYHDTGTGNDRVLNQVSVPIISRETCNRPQFYRDIITPRMLCAGFQDGGRDACQVRGMRLSPRTQTNYRIMTIRMSQ